MDVDPTQLGYLIVPLTILIALFYPRWALPWVFVLAPLQATSVLIIQMGGYPIGVQPGYFAAGCFIVTLVIKSLGRGYVRVSRKLLYVYAPLFAFAAFAAFSAVVLPRAFEGTLDVFAHSEGVISGELTSLQPAPTNVSQTIYLVFLVVFAVAVSLDIINFGQRRDPKFYYVPYLIAGSLVALIGFYQLIATYFGVPYPYALLYNNFYAQHYAQSVGEAKRLSSTFTEPAQAAYYLVGVFYFALWVYLFSSRSKLVVLSCVLIGTALILTTSTTAYVALAVMWLFLLLQVVLRRGSSYRAIRLAIVVAPVLVVAFIALYLVGGSEAVWSTFEASTIDKSSSESFEDRSEKSLHSLTLLLPTGGFGVGWGSNRSSGLLFNLLSNAGIWGTALLVWFGVRVYRHTTGAAALPAIGPRQRNLMRAFGVSIVATLVAGLVSVPELISTSFWLNVAVLIALALHAEKTSASTLFKTSTADRASTNVAAVRSRASASSARRGELFRYRG